MKLSSFFMSVFLAALVAEAIGTNTAGQSLVSGQIDGRVTDPIGTQRSMS